MMKYRIRYYKGRYWIQRALFGMWFWPNVGVYKHYTDQWEHVLGPAAYRFTALSGYVSKEAALADLRKIVNNETGQDEYYYVEVK